MHPALSRPTPARRSGLLGIVIAAHLGILLLALAARSVAPQIMEMPLIVDLIQPVAEKQPAARPQPVVPPQAVRPPPSPRPAPPASPSPLAEASPGTVTAPPAATAPPSEGKATSAAPALPEPILPARFDADYLRNPAPAYPALSRRQGETGTVILRVAVTPQGTAESVDVRTSSGSERLDEAARKAVRQWKFIPARRGDIAVASFVLVPIIFKLEQ